MIITSPYYWYLRHFPVCILGFFCCYSFYSVLALSPFTSCIVDQEDQGTATMQNSTQRGPDSAIYNHAELYRTPGQIGQLKSKGQILPPLLMLSSTLLVKWFH
ncbi:hypothetical protein KIL84_001242 [Mauremys mutica]|uniref:Uncharacterized protein n=1 Tax=Mauremys mutica TaxID=74926 RepID=A0A9D3WY75_9SAUR|nr:hypothetical protein KIL84_001242 [Mauremys mutica]